MAIDGKYHLSNISNYILLLSEVTASDTIQQSCSILCLGKSFAMWLKKCFSITLKHILMELVPEHLSETGSSVLKKLFLYKNS